MGLMASAMSVLHHGCYSGQFNYVGENSQGYRDLIDVGNNKVNQIVRQMGDRRNGNTAFGNPKPETACSTNPIPKVVKVNQFGILRS